MTVQRSDEIIKAFASGETAERITAGEGPDAAEAERVRRVHAADIAEKREMLRKAGCLP